MGEEIKKEFDVAIIGGGINGTAIARDAALRGLSVLLLEREDFAAGASSKSSKLAHGGLRYLEQFAFGLVRESLQERGRLLRLAPHLVSPLPFVFPAYRGAKRPLWQIRLGLWLYDWLWRDKCLPKHRGLNSDAILETFPALRSEGLRGGGLYYDAKMEDHRLVIENMLSAERAGAEICHYSPVEGLLHENGHVVGVRYHYRGKEREVRAKVVVNATGPWANGIFQMDPVPGSVRVRPTKGVHIALPQVHPDTALILSAPQDERIFFVIPWEGMSLVGTTDTDFQGDPSRVAVEDEDVNYLLEAFNHYFPSRRCDVKHVISSFAGLRPLVAAGPLAPSALSREHVCQFSPSGMLTILGGKYTTYRAMAEEVVDAIQEKFLGKGGLRRCSTGSVPLDEGFGDGADLSVVSESCLARLQTFYGQGAERVVDYVAGDRALESPLCSLHPHIAAELVYAVEKEKAEELEDWFFRRTYIGYTPCRGLHCLRATADHFQRLLGWSEVEKGEKMERYVKSVST